MTHGESYAYLGQCQKSVTVTVTVTTHSNRTEEFQSLSDSESDSLSEVSESDCHSDCFTFLRLYINSDMKWGVLSTSTIIMQVKGCLINECECGSF